MNSPARTLADDFRRSGKTQQGYCTENNLSIHTLRYHLYKKPRRNSSGLPKPHPPGSPVASTVPSFISFNRETLSENGTRRTFTVIHGCFSMRELVEILSPATPKR